ncbi:MAG TPA: hypothetical protein VFB14_09340 [Bryobacteraceae bacterium]|jgi:hypothetical protein|nr:hypothetical protein [Bryobacteraceae bacterium]
METHSSRLARSKFLLLVFAMACLRVCHFHLLWADEDYHLAAAIHILHGQVPYRDFWYDKPPLNAVYYLLIGGYWGWPLRLLDAAYIVACCCVAYRLAKRWWGPREGRAAALLLAFFTTFYLPSAVIPFAADALMILPQLAAVYYAAAGRAFWAGIYSGIAFLVNAKGLFVLAICGVWLWAELPVLILGFVLPVAAGAIWAVATGALAGYWEQVWRWGWLYARESPVTHPFRVGVVRTADWLGFHAALLAGSICAFTKMSASHRWRLGVWLAVSYASVCLGTRFAPHYFFQLLPGMVIMASRGVVLAFERHRKIAAVVVAVLLVVPLVRFGPRYAMLAADDIEHHAPHWSDVVMDLDSQAVARQILAKKKPGDTLFVWGYRPDIYVYTRLSSDGKFWDSQPLTGVPADRHLSAIEPIYGGPAAANRREFVRSHPTFFVDGLGLLNPRLKPGVYPELRPWLAGYQLIGRTKLSLIYCRVE